MTRGTPVKVLANAITDLIDVELAPNLLQTSSTLLSDDAC